MIEDVLQLVDFQLCFVDALSYLVFRRLIALDRRLRDSSDDAFVQTLGFGCQILVFSYQLCEFISSRSETSSKFGYGFASGG